MGVFRSYSRGLGGALSASSTTPASYSSTRGSPPLGYPLVTSVCITQMQNMFIPSRKRALLDPSPPILGSYLEGLVKAFLNLSRRSSTSLTYGGRPTNPEYNWLKRARNCSLRHKVVLDSLRQIGHNFLVTWHYHQLEMENCCTKFQAVR